MRKKVVTLLKMILVSIGLIAIVTIVDRKTANDAESEYDAENTEYFLKKLKICKKIIDLPPCGRFIIYLRNFLKTK